MDRRTGQGTSGLRPEVKSRTEVVMTAAAQDAAEGKSTGFFRFSLRRGKKKGDDKSKAKASRGIFSMFSRKKDAGAADEPASPRSAKKKGWFGFSKSEKSDKLEVKDGKLCTSCGTKCPVAAKFCMECGMPMRAAA